LIGKEQNRPMINDLETRLQIRCETHWLQLPPNYGSRFQSFEVMAVTMRYMILRGTTRDQVRYVEFTFGGGKLCLPDFYLEATPLRGIC
jgi:hypothetical protein